MAWREFKNSKLAPKKMCKKIYTIYSLLEGSQKVWGGGIMTSTSVGGQDKLEYMLGRWVEVGSGPKVCSIDNFERKFEFWRQKFQWSAIATS